LDKLSRKLDHGTILEFGDFIKELNQSPLKANNQTITKEGTEAIPLTF